MKNLRLKPSMREKKRYLLLEVNLRISKNKISELIEKTIKEYIGILGFAKASPQILDIKEKQRNYNVVLAVNRNSLNEVKAAFCISEEKITVSKVSGSIKNLK